MLCNQLDRWDIYYKISNKHGAWWPWTGNHKCAMSENQQKSQETNQDIFITENIVTKEIT